MAIEKYEVELLHCLEVLSKCTNLKRPYPRIVQLRFFISRNIRVLYRYDLCSAHFHCWLRMNKSFRVNGNKVETLLRNKSPVVYASQPKFEGCGKVKT